MAEGRKIMFFLGAGASYGAGATATIQGGGELPIPTQKDFWETVLRFCKSNKHRKQIESFLFRYFSIYRRVPARSKAGERRRLLNGVDVEEVFTFLSERTRAPSTSSQLRKYMEEVWESLVMEIGQVFQRFLPNQQTRKIYRDLLNNHIRSHDVVVSFNYDTVFENSLPQRKRWAYEGLEDCTSKLRVIKPHGSVNWEYTDRIRKKKYPSKSVIVAPTHLKFVSTVDKGSDNESLVGYLDQAQEIEAIWATLESQMREAKVLIFIGYSFPVADLYFSSILRSVLASRDSAPSLVLVNPDSVALAKRLVSRFSVSEPVRFFDMQQFVQSTRQHVLSLAGQGN